MSGQGPDGAIQGADRSVPQGDDGSSTEADLRLLPLSIKHAHKNDRI